MDIEKLEPLKTIINLTTDKNKIIDKATPDHSHAEPRSRTARQNFPNTTPWRHRTAPHGRERATTAPSATRRTHPRCTQSALHAPNRFATINTARRTTSADSARAPHPWTNLQCRAQPARRS